MRQPVDPLRPPAPLAPRDLDAWRAAQPNLDAWRAALPDLDARRAALPELYARRAALWRALEAEPWRHDFFATLRRIECLHPELPRIGRAARPADEALRLAQQPSLAFAPAALAGLAPGDGTRPPRLAQHFFGLLGPNGALPLHLSDYVRERRSSHGDATLASFLDLFHHRMLALFYRAWAQAQPTVSFDRPRDDRFADQVGSCIGIGAAALRQRDAAGDRIKLHHAGTLARQVRNADGLRALLADFFCAPVRIEQHVGHWMALPAAQRSRIGWPRAPAAARLPGGRAVRNAGSGSGSGLGGRRALHEMNGRHGAQGMQARLGADGVLGERVWDRQHKLRIHIGPLALADFEALLPGGAALPQLVALVRQYIGFELAWDARIWLARAEQPRLRLGGAQRIGLSGWLGARRAAGDAGELVLDAEAVMARRLRRASGKPQGDGR